MNEPDCRTYTVEALNRLRTAEKRSLLPRLAELHVFVDWALGREMDQVRRMIAEQSRHDAWLIEAAEDCDAALSPASADVHTASLHYLDLRTLLPRVIASTDTLVQLYAQTLNNRDKLTPAAAETLARIHNRHQVHLDQLRQIHNRLTAAPTA